MSEEDELEMRAVEVARSWITSEDGKLCCRQLSKDLLRKVCVDFYRAGWLTHAAQAQPKLAPPEPEWWWPDPDDVAREPEPNDGDTVMLIKAYVWELEHDWLRLKRLAGELPEEAE